MILGAFLMIACGMGLIILIISILDLILSFILHKIDCYKQGIDLSGLHNGCGTGSNISSDCSAFGGDSSSSSGCGDGGCH